MKNAMLLLLMGIAPAAVFPLAAGAVPDGAAYDGFRGKAAVIESAQIPETEPNDFEPFPMSGGKKEGCSGNDAGGMGDRGKDPRIKIRDVIAAGAEVTPFPLFFFGH